MRAYTAASPSDHTAKKTSGNIPVTANRISNSNPAMTYIKLTPPSYFA